MECLSEMFGADIPEEDITKALEDVKNKYEDEAFSLQLVHTGGGYQFLTKPAYLGT
jgi:segregation and condensation protein B